MPKRNQFSRLHFFVSLLLFLFFSFYIFFYYFCGVDYLSALLNVANIHGSFDDNFRSAYLNYPLHFHVRFESKFTEQKPGGRSSCTQCTVKMQSLLCLLFKSFSSDKEPDTFYLESAAEVVLVTNFEV